MGTDLREKADRVTQVLELGSARDDFSGLRLKTDLLRRRACFPIAESHDLVLTNNDFRRHASLPLSCRLQDPDCHHENHASSATQPLVGEKQCKRRGAPGCTNVAREAACRGDPSQGYW